MSRAEPTREPVAIVGMACRYPGAGDLAAFWRNLVRGVDAVREVPPARWSPRRFGVEHVRGGFLDGHTGFDPLPLGIMPAAVAEGDPEQFLVAGVVREALEDVRSGGGRSRDDGRLAPQRTELVIGRGGYLGNGIEHVHLRMEVVDQAAELLERLAGGLDPVRAGELRALLAAAVPPITAEGMASAMPNLTAGRVANRLDLTGASYTVDAACASALVAVDRVVESLRAGRCDLGVAAAVHVNQKPSFWLAFHTLGVLSPTGVIRPFDADADGLVTGEGIAAVVLKRLADARADGDRVYAVVHAVGVSSDGRGAGLLAPRLEGEVAAITAAYEASGLDPATVGLVEGHGTAVPGGDAVEIAALRRVFTSRRVALGSVKSMIGHAMPAAGMAGLQKAALALYHRVLPPTLNVHRPHPDLEGSNLDLNTVARPWIEPPGSRRRAGVDAFGFGGINAHALLEEPAERPAGSSLTPAPRELVALSAPSRAELASELESWRGVGGRLDEIGLAAAARAAAERFDPGHPVRLAVVTGTAAELESQLERAVDRLGGDEPEWLDGEGSAFGSGPPPGRLAVLFPGIGFPGLAGGYAPRLAELAMLLPRVTELLDHAESLVPDDGLGYPLHHQLFPPPLLEPGDLVRLERELAWSDRTPVAVLMSLLATWSVLADLGVAPDAVAGFSLGEWAALAAGGAVDLERVDARSLVADWMKLRGEAGAAGGFRGRWAMVGAPAEQVVALLRQVAGRASVAMDVAPEQVFVAGEAAAVEELLERCAAAGIWGQELPPLPILEPFVQVHTTLARPFAAPFAALLGRVPVQEPRCAVYSGVTAEPYPTRPRRIRQLMLEGTTRPVLIRQTVTNLYRDGVRIFVQLGVGAKLLGAIRSSLPLDPHIALAVDAEHRGGVEQLLLTLGRLAALGVPWRPERLWSHRAVPARPHTELASEPESRRELSLTPPRLAPDAAALARLRELVGAGGLRPDAAAPMDPADPLAAARTVLDELVALDRRLDEQDTALMEELLAVQETVVKGMLGAAVGEDAGAAVKAAATPGAAGAAVATWPLLGELRRLDPGRSLEASLVLDLARHPFLGDHTLINVPEGLRPLEERLPTYPLTFALETIAEAAARLVPEAVVVGCHQVEARRWIVLDGARTAELGVAARRVAEDEVEVEITPAGLDGPSLRGRARLAAALPPPPEPWPRPALAPCPHSAAEFYARGPLFHGPLFRVISGLEGMAEGEVRAELEVASRAAIAVGGDATTLLEPVVMDGLAQVAGYRAWLDGWLVMPVGLDRLTRYGPPVPPGERVRGAVRLLGVEGRTLRADLELLDPDGRVWLRLEGLRDWRVFCPPALLEANHRPREGFLGEPVPVSEEAAVCMRVTRDALGDLEPDWIARAYLSAREWRELRGGAGSQRLLGRIAAKDALRRWLTAARGGPLHPLEVELAGGDDEPVRVARPAGLPVAVSVSHVEGAAVAAVAEARGVGIDLTRIEARDRAFETTAFAETERALLPAGSEWLHRAWAAKEAAVKAWGRGLEAVGALRVTAVDEAGERLTLSWPDGAAVEAVSWRDGDLVGALAVREPS